jgi:hypothetical protein
MQKIIYLLIFTLLLLPACKTSSKEPETPKPENLFLSQQLRNSLKAYDLMRNDIGVYADAVKFDGKQNVPCSVASVGMALVALCAADATGNDAQAGSKALQTLKSFSGKTNGFNPARNPVNGFFRHWIDMESGVRAWNSEYSSIDTGILVAGALFCKSYFSNSEEIAQLADSLYLSVNWSASIANSETGQIWMVFEENGGGSLPTKPFNEYMITAWLAKNDKRDNSEATALWDNHYADPSALPKKEYEGYELLTDADHYLSNFVIQFPYYLCHPFTTSESYISYLTNALNADLKWWTLINEPSEYIWGTGAGPALSGYNADNFDNNPGKICSPHIIAGFIPIRPQSLEDLEKLWDNDLGRYALPGDTSHVLWRFSTIKSDWIADGAAGVDWSTMVFGLAAHPDALGSSFFKTHNDFQFP